MGKTILAVDDSASMRQMVTFTLQEAGYEVVDATDGVEALAKLATVRANMVITDLNMPRMNGIELIRQIRAQAQHRFIPIVMLTTESQEERKREGKAAGATGWIVKPFRADQLVTVVKRLLP